MRLTIITTLTLILISFLTFGQHNLVKDRYDEELKLAGKSFSSYFYPNYPKIYSFNEKEFVSKIDSARYVFNTILKKYESQLEPQYATNQYLEIKYYFDKLLLDYPISHQTYLQTKKKVNLSKKLSNQLQSNLNDFNKPDLLLNADFREYVKAYFHHSITEELENPIYKNTDNQSLNAVWKLVTHTITNESCLEYWRTHYLFYHIENNGIKNIEPILKDFRASCKNASFLEKVNTIYSEDSIIRQKHITKTYKSINGVTLELHLFLPNSLPSSNKSPVYVYFHGGSWSEGKPDWGFASCENYAKKGWTGVAVEYRTASRHNTLPFESVKDAKSAIRWLRKNATVYNIDTSKIVATGNSAGGHLVLTTALADEVNEQTDDLRMSPTPNILLVNSGVYDLTIDNTKWITRNLKNKELVKQISPNHLVKRNMPPLLVVHGTNDGNCPYWTAEKFRDDLETINTKFEFHSLDGAGHFIWYEPNLTGQISKWRNEFLIRHGFD